MLVNISRRSVFNELRDNVRAWKFRKERGRDNMLTGGTISTGGIIGGRGLRKTTTTTIIYDDGRIIIITITGTWSE